MAAIRRSPIWPDPRVKPPFGAAQINWGHPLARGLIACWLFNEGGGDPIDLSQLPRRATITDRTNMKWSAGAGESGLRQLANTGTTRGVTLSPTLSLLTSSTFSVETRIVPTSVGDSYGALLTYGTSRGMWFRGALLQNSWFVGTDHLNTTAITAGTLHTYLATIASGTNLSWYLDGKADGTATITDVNYDFEAIGNDTSSETFDGLVVFTRVWNTLLSPAAALWLHAEPYAFLQPVIRRRWFVPAAAGAPTGGVVTPRSLGLLGVGA